MTPPPRRGAAGEAEAPTEGRARGPATAFSRAWCAGPGGDLGTDHGPPRTRARTPSSAPGLGGVSVPAQTRVSAKGVPPAALRPRGAAPEGPLLRPHLDERGGFRQPLSRRGSRGSEKSTNLSQDAGGFRGSSGLRPRSLNSKAHCMSRQGPATGSFGDTWKG